MDRPKRNQGGNYTSSDPEAGTHGGTEAATRGGTEAATRHPQGNRGGPWGRGLGEGLAPDRT